MSTVFKMNNLTIPIKALLHLFGATLVNIDTVRAFGSFSILKHEGSAWNKSRILNVCVVFVYVFMVTLTKGFVDGDIWLRY